MATYSLDPEAAYSDNDGSDRTTNVLTGPAGLQAAIRGTGNATALVAGDLLEVKAGTFDLSRLVWLDVDTDVSGWGLGDVVDTNIGSQDWQGIVVEISYGGNNDQVLVWLDSGYTEDNVDLADGIFNVHALGGAGDPTTAGLDAKDTKGIEFDNNQGTAASPITIRGKNNSWIADGTQMDIDGNSKADYCITGSDTDYINLENADIHHAAGHCAYVDSVSYCYRWNFVNVTCRDSVGGSGWQGNGSSKAWSWCTWKNCKAYGNNSYGVYARVGIFDGMVAYNNGNTGVRTVDSAYMSNSAIYENAGTYGVQLAAASVIWNSVIDAHARCVAFSGTTLDIVGCRITDFSTYGIDIAAGQVRAYHNYIDDNGEGGSDFNGTPITQWKASSDTNTYTGTVGYIDAANATLADRDYGLTNQATARRQEVTL